MDLNVLKQDLYDLNLDTLHLAADVAETTQRDPRTIGMTPEVARGIARSEPDAREVAAACGVALVSVRRGARESAAPERRAPVIAWQRSALSVIQRCLLADRTLALFWFDLPPAVADTLAGCSLRGLDALASRRGMVSLSFGDDPGC
jgi:hypothetical protein